MKITGIVSEYNPFHKGHEYQLNKARQLSRCDGIAVVMSGNYVQRGEPAIIDKYKRAVSAIHGGADLVIELPMPFACQNAEKFAWGAMSELKKVPVDCLSFGCENDNLETLKTIARAQINNSDYNHILKEEIKKGISYPRAVSNAVSQICDNQLKEVIMSPNNILAIEYIKNSIKLNLNWNFVPIKRIGKEHNDLNVTGQYDSATAIRKELHNGTLNYSELSLTDCSMKMINNFYKEFNGFNSLQNYLELIYYKILDIGLEGLNDIYEISEGLNNKIYSNIFKYDNVDDYIISLKSKRYTYSKLRRILLNILLDIRKSDRYLTMSAERSNKLYIEKENISNNEFNRSFIKVLAFNDVGREIIKLAKNNGTVIINRYSDYKKYNISPYLFDFTNKTTNIYYIPFKNRKINMEYTENASYIK